MCKCFCRKGHKSYKAYQKKLRMGMVGKVFSSPSLSWLARRCARSVGIRSSDAPHDDGRRIALPYRAVWVCCVLCLRICGKCRASFGRDACAAFALPSPRSTIIKLPLVASSSRLQHHHRAVRLVSRHFPRLHGAFRSASIPLVALLSHPL
jgi:hypothetical protein